jgi:hypothetical protein
MTCMALEFVFKILTMEEIVQDLTVVEYSTEIQFSY